MNCARVVIMMAIAGALATASMEAFGSQSVLFGGKLGGGNIGAAYLPPPGLSVAGVYVGINNFGNVLAPALYGSQGPLVGSHLRSSGNIFGVGLNYTYPFKIFGGTAATFFQLAYGSGPTDVNGVQRMWHGFRDLYFVPFSWSKRITYGNATGAAEDSRLPYGLTTKFQLGMILPTGTYAPRRIPSSGFHTRYYIPSAAVTYLTGPNWLGDGLQLNAQVYFNYAKMNSDGNYKSGNTWDVSLTAAEVVGRLTYGINTFYAWQISPDSENGAIVIGPGPKNIGKKFMEVGVGPVVSYAFPKLKANLKVTFNMPVKIKNTIPINQFFVVFAKHI